MAGEVVTALWHASLAPIIPFPLFIRRSSPLPEAPGMQSHVSNAGHLVQNGEHLERGKCISGQATDMHS